MMNWDAIETPAEPGASMLAATAKEDARDAVEKGRLQILAGWIITMIGIVGYIVAMSRAPEGADMLDALTGQGWAGWGSLALLLTGVVVWVAGSVAMLHDISETPRS